MKKQLSILATFVLFGVFSFQAWATIQGSVVAPSGQTIYYTTYFGYYKAKICSPHGYSTPWYGYTKPTGDLVIPDSISINGATYYVTDIDNHAFDGCSGLSSVSIPNTVTSIGDFSFRNCSGLTSVTIGTGVTSIGKQAFRSCGSLTSVVFNAINCTSVGDYYDNDEHVQYTTAFCYCPNITSVTFGNNVQYIPSVFREMTNLTSITIPNSVTSIGSCAFYGCTGLSSIVIPDNVTSIYSSAFYGCTSLDTIYMMPTTPPALYHIAVFSNNASGRVFILNGCSYNNYYFNNFSSSENYWYYYRSSLRDPIIDISILLSSSDTTRGSTDVILGRSNRVVRCDSTVVISATANNGYHFDHWSNGNTTNPDTIALVGDSTVIAYFAPSSYAITGVSCDNVRGTVTGSDTVGYLDTVTLIAHPNYGYHLDHWTYTNENNNNISTRQGGDTLILVATRDRTATAYFAPNQYLLTVNTENPSYGDVYGGGMYDYLSIRTISAVARSGYRFDHWSTGSIDNPYMLTVTSDTTITAYFVSTSSTEGIGEIGEDDIRISVSDGRIHVEGITNEEVRVYDITGRLVQNHSLQPGVYMVKIGTLPPQKVVVMR